MVPAQPTTHVFTPTAHQQTLPDEFDCSDCDTEHERIHKVIEICLRHDKRTGEQQGPVKSEEPMSEFMGIDVEIINALIVLEV